MGNNLPLVLHAVSCHETELIWPAQFLLLLNLNGDARLEGNPEGTMPRGTSVFLVPYSGCRIRLEKGSSVLYAELDQSFVESMIGTPKKHCVLFSEEETYAIAEKMVQLFELQTQSGQSKKTQPAHLQSYSIVFELLGILEPMITFLPEHAEQSGEDRGARFREYLAEHFREQIQLQDLADAFGLSRQHASTAFHLETGRSFSEYLQSFRLSETVRLLVTTDQNISEICQKSGFPNQKAMQNAFHKEYGMTPREYRTAEQIRSKQRAELHWEAVKDETLLQNFSAMLQPYRMIYEKSGQQFHLTNVVAPAKPDTPERREAWRDILNVDYAIMLLYGTVQQELRSMQSILKFQYVRLGNIFSIEFTPYTPASGRHRLTYFIQVIDFLRGIGLTPMLALGDNFSVSENFVMVNDSPYSVAKKDWLEMLENLLRVSIENWGADWVSTWRFEFHMPSQLYGSSDPAIFLDTFADSCALVHRYVPGAAVGGPGMRMDAEHMPRWEAWFSFVRKEKIQVDFVSVEQWAEYTCKQITFGGQFQEQRYAQSVGKLNNADAGLAIDRVRQVREKMRAAGFSDTKLYVAALGITKYQAQAAQLGGHCPAWLIRVISGLTGLADGIGCWKAFNHEAEYPDEYHVLGYGCGMLGRYGIRTPSWYAYDFLARLYPNMLLREQYCCVTGDDSGKYAILLHNCKDYSQYFCRNYLEPEALKFTDKRCYTNQTALVQTLILPELPEGVTACSVHQYLLGDHHGCAANILEQMGEISRLSEEQIAYITGQSLPYQYSYRLMCSGKPELTVTLQPNEVMLLIVEPE